MYEAWDRPEQIAKWRVKLAGINAEIVHLQNKDGGKVSTAADDE